MRDWKAVLGRNVRRMRQQKGLTQEELAFEAKIDLTYLASRMREDEPDGTDRSLAIFVVGVPPRRY